MTSSGNWPFKGRITFSWTGRRERTGIVQPSIERRRTRIICGTPVPFGALGRIPDSIAVAESHALGQSAVVAVEKHGGTGSQDVNPEKAFREVHGGVSSVFRCDGIETGTGQASPEACLAGAAVCGLLSAAAGRL